MRQIVVTLDIYGYIIYILDILDIFVSPQGKSAPKTLKSNRCGAPAAFVVGQLLLTSLWYCISGLRDSYPSADPSGRGHGQGCSAPAALLSLLNTTEALGAREYSEVGCSANDSGEKSREQRRSQTRPILTGSKGERREAWGQDGTLPVPSSGGRC